MNVLSIFRFITHPPPWSSKLLYRVTCLFDLVMVCKVIFVYNSSPAFAFFATVLSRYVDNIVHHIVKISQYCHGIVTILSTYCENSVYHIVNFHNSVNIYVNHMWSQYYEISTILWPHTVNIYVNPIVVVDNVVDNIVTICWRYWWVFYNMVNCCRHIVTILWLKMRRLVMLLSLWSFFFVNFALISLVKPRAFGAR